MTVEQFVMAYGAEQDRLRALLPEGFASLRPVLRINAEVRDGKRGLSSSTLPRKKPTIAAGSTSAAGTMFPLRRTAKRRPSRCRS